MLWGKEVLLKNSKFSFIHVYARNYKPFSERSLLVRSHRSFCMRLFMGFYNKFFEELSKKATWFIFYLNTISINTISFIKNVIKRLVKRFKSLNRWDKLSVDVKRFGTAKKPLFSLITVCEKNIFRRFLKLNIFYIFY